MILRAKIKHLTISFLCVCILCACGKKEEKTNPNAKQVSFMYFGSVMEKKATADMIQNFEEKFKNIYIKKLYVPDENYNAKMATLVASGNTPDVAYLNGEQLFDYAKSGKILTIDECIKKDKNFNPDDRLDIGKYYQDGKLIAMSTAMETIVLYYNKEIFDKAGIPYPPANVKDAWSWDKFLEVSKKLTVDRNGKHPGENGFNPESIKQYGSCVLSGISSSTNWMFYIPLAWSNGGNLASEDGKKILVDQPEFYKAIQNIADLANKYHVSPNPAQRKSMPSTDIALKTKQVAMMVGGQWSLLGLNKNKVPYGIGVLPVMKKPATMGFGSPTVIFKSAKHPDAAWEFYKYHNTVKYAPSLFKNGLWMPMEKKYYTDEKLMKDWIDNPSHPKEYKTAVVDYFLKYAKKAPGMTLKNWGKIQEKLSASLDSVWLGNDSAENVLKKLAPEIQPLMNGRYSK